MILRLFFALFLAGFASHASAYVWRQDGSYNNWQYQYFSIANDAALNYCRNNYYGDGSTVKGLSVDGFGVISFTCGYIDNLPSHDHQNRHMAPLCPGINDYWANWQCTTCPVGLTLNQSTGKCLTIPSCDAAHCIETAANPIKNNAAPPLGSCAGNPINIGTGNKYQLESEYQGAGDFPLLFERTYNSDASTFSERLGTGSGWRHSYERSITSTGNSNLVVAYRSDGRAYTFSLVGNNWLPVVDVNLQLSGASTTGWQLTTEDGSVETYDTSGKLQSIQSPGGAKLTLSHTNGLLTTITHSNGRSLTLSYDSALRLTSMQDPAGGLTLYGYNATTGDLETVTYPDATPADLTDNPVKTYVYNEAANTAGANLPHALTGIVDENHKRFATFQYDTQRRAISTQHAGGAGFVGVNYGTDSNVVTDALGTPRTHRFQVVQGVVKSAGSNQPAGAGCGAASSNLTYDANGNIASRTDFNGHKTCYAYDLSRNLETQRIEGLPASADCAATLVGGTLPAPARQITTSWHATYRLPLAIAEPQKFTTYTYFPSGLVNTRSEQATSDLDGRAGLNPTVQGSARTWTMTYNDFGQVKTLDGPRTDVNDTTVYTYTTDGHSDLATITNPLGQVTRFGDYDANGRARTITAANGVVTRLDFYPRGWLKTLTLTGGTNVETTQYTYTPSGQLKTVTPPDGSVLTYGYDDAQRLTSITDNLGNKITYTLDNAGNRINEAVADSGGGLRRNIAWTYDALNRLQTVTGAAQ